MKKINRFNDPASDKQVSKRMVKIKHFCAFYRLWSARLVIKGAAVVVRMLLVNTDCNGGGNSEAHLTADRASGRSKGITGPDIIWLMSEKNHTHIFNYKRLCPSVHAMCVSCSNVILCALLWLSTSQCSDWFEHLNVSSQSSGSDYKILLSTPVPISTFGLGFDWFND